MIVPAADTVILAEAFLPISALFSRSAAYMTVAIPDPLLYPAPELVTDNNGTLSVAYGNLTGYLIEAVKELKAEIKELKKQIK